MKAEQLKDLANRIASRFVGESDIPLEEGRQFVESLLLPAFATRNAKAYKCETLDDAAMYISDLTEMLQDMDKERKQGFERIEQMNNEWTAWQMRFDEEISRLIDEKSHLEKILNKADAYIKDVENEIRERA